MINDAIFAGVAAPCCSGLYDDACICPHTERVLRCYAYREGTMPTMTQAQREWCLREIGSIEGYDWNDYVGDTDSDLARTVLSAWVDYCRDKGLM